MLIALDMFLDFVNSVVLASTPCTGAANVFFFSFLVLQQTVYFFVTWHLPDAPAMKSFTLYKKKVPL